MRSAPGALSPNEARLKYFGLGPVPGGDYAVPAAAELRLAALAKRDADDPFAKPADPAPAPTMLPAVDDAADEAKFFATFDKAIAGLSHAA